MSAHRSTATRLLAATWLLTATSALAGAADRFAAVEIETTQVADHVYMLEGAGGNIAASVGADGVLIVDDQFAALAQRIADAIAALDGEAPRFVLNTHFHGDHTGSNAFFGRTGTILAHRNVRQRLVAGDMPAAGLPVVTFDDRLRMHFNGDEIDIIHLPRGHTDGDAVVWFKDANVIHMGDHLFAGRFPFVDVASGGRVDGLLANLVAVVDWLPPDAKVIPGHGALAKVADIATAIDVIRDSQAVVREAVANDALDALKRDGFGRWPEWGFGFISEARWIDIIVQSDLAAGQ